MLTAGPGGVTEDPFSLLDRPVSQALPELTQAPLNSQLWGRATPRASEVSVLGVRELSAAEVAALPSNKAQRTPGAPLRAIAKVKARHHEIARLIAAGAKDVEISEALGLSGGTLYRLRRSPAFQQLLFSYMAARDQEAISMSERIAHGAALALDRVSALLEDEDSQVSVGQLTSLTQMLLDRAGFNPTTKVQATSVALTGEEILKMRQQHAAHSATVVNGVVIRNEPPAGPAGRGGSESAASSGGASVGQVIPLAGGEGQRAAVREELRQAAEARAEHEGRAPVDPLNAALAEILGE